MNESEIQKIIIDAANEFYVAPELLLAIAKAESNFDPTVISDKGAKGLFQFMDGTFGDAIRAIKPVLNPEDPYCAKSFGELPSTAGVCPDTATVDGQTPAVDGSSPNDFERLLKGTVTGAHDGAIAIMSVTPTTSGTCQAGSTTITIKLAAGASDSDDTYNNYVVRTTGGTGSNQIRRIIDYVGSTRVATVWEWTGDTPDNTTTYEVAPGMYFDKVPYECLVVARPFYGAEAPESGSNLYYEKVHVRNCNNESPPLDFTNAKLTEIATNLHAEVDFAIEDAVDDNNTATDRTTEPSGNGSWITDQTATALQNGGILEPVMDQGIWLRLTLASTDSATNSQWDFKFTGSTT